MSGIEEPVRLSADAQGAEPLRTLLRAVADDGPTDAELAGLTRRVGPLLSAPPAVPSSALLSARTLLIGLAVVGIGGGIAGYVLSRGDRAAPATPAIRIEPPQLALPPAIVAPPEPAPSTPIAEPKPAPKPLGVAKPRAEPTSEPAPLTQVSEVALLEQARHALRDGDADRALVVAAEHARQFPDGVLSEEREALVIEALAKLDRIDEARARWSRFATTYPRSNYRARLQRLMEVRDRP